MAARYSELQAQLSDLSREVISDAELATISPLMAGQSAIPELEGRNAVQIFQDSLRTNSAAPPAPDDEMFEDDDPDYTLGYNPEPTDGPLCNPLNCHPITPFEDLANLLRSSPNPTSTEILDLLRSVSSMNIMDKDILYTKYTLLIKVCGNDWPLIKDPVIQSMRKSYNSVLCCIEGMLQVYQIQHAKAINNNLISLGQATDDIKTATKQLTDQSKMDQTFTRDFTKQINHVTASIAQFMETLELKTLELHHPSRRSSRPPPVAPTADSASSPQVNLPGLIRDEPCTKYRNELLSITLDQNRNMIASANTASAQPLVSICTLPASTQVICKILNKDLCRISKQTGESVYNEM